MVDSPWLKNLAEAEIKGEKWTHKDQTSVQKLAQKRVTEAIDSLAEEAAESATIHNDHAPAHRKIGFVTIPSKLPEHGGGFRLFLGRTQIGLDYRMGALIATLTTSEGFALKSREIHRFLPHADPFGSVMWSRDNALLMTPELIIKRLLEDLTRAALLAGDTKGDS
jgi:hypothetical protein